MNKEESLKLLRTYINENWKCQQMLPKIKELEDAIYNAQAGFVENETGCAISGGNHITRAERIASLCDIKDDYIRAYERSENICKNILKLIQKIFTNRDGEENEILTDKQEYKLQQYENILTEYYINRKSQIEIANSNGFSWRHIARLIDEAREYFWKLYQDNEFIKLLGFIKCESIDNIVTNYSNCTVAIGSSGKGVATI